MPHIGPLSVNYTGELTTVMRALLPSLMRLPMVDLPIGKPMTADSAPFTISKAVVMAGVLGSTAAMAADVPRLMGFLL